MGNNVKLHVGLFSETWSAFTQEHPESIELLHVDCNTYESTSRALEILGSQIKNGTVVVFDEYIGFPGWRFGEFQAWQEFVKKDDITYEYMGFSDQTALFRIL